MVAPYRVLISCAVIFPILSMGDSILLHSLLKNVPNVTPILWLFNLSTALAVAMVVQQPQSCEASHPQWCCCSWLCGEGGHRNYLDDRSWGSRSLCMCQELVAAEIQANVLIWMGFMQQELVAWEVNAGRLGPEKVFEQWWYRNVMVLKPLCILMPPNGYQIMFLM